jgi:hypothetical protein
MQKIVVVAFIGVLLVGTAVGQVKKQFVVEDSESCGTIKLRLQSNSGQCFIKPSQNPDILTVFSNQSEEAFSHTFKKLVNNKTCEVHLALEETDNQSFSQTISSRVFTSSDTKATTVEKFWKMYLTESKPYALEMIYGVGDAHIDLSGLAIQKLKISSGSADVDVDYSSGMENQVEMDTFFVKVDLGSVSVKNLSFSRAKCVLADVGFGNMLLDFTEKPLVSNRIKGSVGAGNLVIILPNDNTPVLVQIHDSWLCSVKMPASLKKSGESTFSTANYTKDAKQALMFDLDVSMGNIVFKEANR